MNEVERGLIRVQKRVLAALMIILFGLACSSEPPLNKNKFAQLRQAAQEARTLIAADASYRQLSEKVQGVSREVSAVNATATTHAEKDLLKAYSDLLAMYQDGLLLWRYRLDFARFDFVPEGRIYVGQDVEPIVDKYGFDTVSHLHHPSGQHWKSISADSIRTIWSNVDSQMKIIQNITDY